MEPQEPRRDQDPPTEPHDATSLGAAGETPAGGSTGAPSTSDASAGTQSWPATPATPAASDSSFSEAGWQQAPAQPTQQPGWGQPPAQPSAPGAWHQPPQTWPQQPAAAPTWQQPPSQPPAQSWQQAPAQPSWGQSAAGWGDPNAALPSGAHHHSFAVALASIFLGFWGFLFTVIGLVFLLGGNALIDAIRRSDADITGGQLDQIAAATGVVAVVMLVIGLPHLLAAIWAPLHSGWARVLGIIVSVLGVLLGVITLTARPTGAGSSADAQASGLIGALFFLIPYGFALVALIFSRKHFRR